MTTFDPAAPLRVSAPLLVTVKAPSVISAEAVPAKENLRANAPNMTLNLTNMIFVFFIF
jgi:hypothetical protein